MTASPASERPCFAHRHMTLKEFGLWNYLRSVSYKSGLIHFDGRQIATQFHGVSKSTIYRVRDSLLTGGWLVMSKGPKKMATGIYSSAEYQALSHDEWAKLHPGLCNVEWMPTNALTSQPVPRAGLTGPTGGTNPVPRAGQNLMLNLNLKELEYPVSDTEGEPNTDQPLPVASRRITSVSASPGTNPNTTEPHPLPENFQSDESNIRYAKKQGLNLEEELTLFMELHGSIGNERRNWQKVFRKWLIDAAPLRGHVVDLPDWLPVKEWNQYLAMRERIRRGASKHAQGLGIQILSKLREQGFSIAGVLDRSTGNNWTDLIRAASGMTPRSPPTATGTGNWSPNLR